MAGGEGDFVDVEISQRSSDSRREILERKRGDGLVWFCRVSLELHSMEWRDGFDCIAHSYLAGKLFSRASRCQWTMMVF